MKQVCEICEGKGYVVSERSDGMLAVERCDTCEQFANDPEAARVATRDGIYCDLAYPCYVR